MPPDIRLSRNFLSSRRVGRGALFQLRPGEVFPIDVLEDDGKLSYVPVDVDSVWQERSRGIVRARTLALADNFEEEKDRVDHFFTTAQRFGEEFEKLALFYLLGYDLDATFLIDARRAEPLESFLDRYKIRDPFLRIRAIAALAPGRQFYAQDFIALEEQRRATEKFQREVVVPAGEAEAIILTQVAFFLEGGAALEVVAEGGIRIGAWVFEWLFGLRFQTALFLASRALLNAGRGGVIAFTLFSLAREAAALLIQLGNLALAVKATLDVAAEILGKFFRILDYFLGLHLHETNLLQAGGEDYDGWISSPDPSEDSFLDFLQQQMNLTPAE